MGGQVKRVYVDWMMCGGCMWSEPTMCDRCERHMSGHSGRSDGRRVARDEGERRAEGDRMSERAREREKEMLERQLHFLPFLCRRVDAFVCVRVCRSHTCVCA